MGRRFFQMGDRRGESFGGCKASAPGAAAAEADGACFGPAGSKEWTPVSSTAPVSGPNGTVWNASDSTNGAGQPGRIRPAGYICGPKCLENFHNCYCYTSSRRFLRAERPSEGAFNVAIIVCGRPLRDAALRADVCDSLPTSPPKEATLYGSNAPLSFKLSVKSGGTAFRITVRPLWQIKQSA